VGWYSSAYPPHIMAKGVVMTEAYMVDGLYFCRECFKVQYYIGYKPDKLLASDDFHDRLILCDACEEDVFGRTITISVKDVDWLVPWPEKEGHYWFHGWLYGDDGIAAPETYLVQALRPITSGGKKSKKVIYITEGDLLYAHEACGVWRPLELPVPPQELKGEV